MEPANGRNGPVAGLTKINFLGGPSDSRHEVTVWLTEVLTSSTFTWRIEACAAGQTMAYWNRRLTPDWAEPRGSPQEGDQYITKW